MSYKTISSLLTKFFFLSILLAVAGQALASRGNPKTTNNNNGEMKQPEWFHKSDHSVLIPGIGRVMVPPAFSHSHYGPYIGHIGGTGRSGSGTGTGTGIGTGTGTGTGTGRHIPGGDDTFVPNPGYEVPIPGTGGFVPSATHP